MSAEDTAIQDLPKMGVVNWIGLYTIVRRDVQRMLRVPIQVFIAPWSSALLFIFVFGFVLGNTMRTIGGHKYIEFVMPGVLMMNIINAAFLQSSSAIYFSRFIRFVEEMLVAPLSYLDSQAPSFLIQQGANDKFTAAAQAHKLYDGLQALHVPSQLIIYPDTGGDFTPVADKAMGDMLDFITKTFPAASAKPAAFNPAAQIHAAKPAPSAAPAASKAKPHK